MDMVEARETVDIGVPQEEDAGATADEDKLRHRLTVFADES